MKLKIGCNIKKYMKQAIKRPALQEDFMPVYQKTIYAGDVKEIEIFFSDPAQTKAAMQRREPKEKNPSSDAQKEKNRRRSNKYKIRKFNANFNWVNALYFTATFKGNSPTLGEAEKLVDNYIRRLRRRAPKMKCVYVVGARGNERVHLHLVASGVKGETLTEQWQYGDVKKIIRLYQHNYNKNGVDCGADYTNLITYMLDHCKDETHGKWHQSRGLIEPDIEVKENRLKKIIVPKPDDGYVLIEKYENKEDYLGIYRYYKYVRLPIN